MPANYQCPSCLEVVQMARIAAKKSADCPACGDEACITPDCEVADDFDPDAERRSKKRARTAMVGRSNAAPAATSWPLSKMNSKVTYVSDLGAAAWTSGAGKAIRLPFKLLDIDDSDTQGLVIELPEMAGDAQALLHFAAITEFMEACRKPTDCTEGTGEAAAAMAVLQNCKGFAMRRGFHCHSGPGIDQIWVSTGVGGAITDVLIVEAKGPGAKESSNRYMPPDFDQMGENWIIHNLATMMSAANASGSREQGELARDILRGLGLTVGLAYPAWGGSSKNYYGTTAFAASSKSMRLHRMTVEAHWQSDGLLAYTATRKAELRSFTVADPDHYGAVQKRYPGMFKSKTAPTITLA